MARLCLCLGWGEVGFVWMVIFLGKKSNTLEIQLHGIRYLLRCMVRDATVGEVIRYVSHKRQ